VPQKLLSAIALEQETKEQSARGGIVQPMAIWGRYETRSQMV
jgi:hypothetical protein